jgi:hypothetical protein
MKIAIILLGIACVAIVFLFTACKKRTPESEAQAAATRGERQFIALLHGKGRWTYPQVPGIPDWYFQHTGILIRTVKPETEEAELAYMKRYNEALYQALKAQGKFHLLEESVARAKTNLDNYEKSKQAK